ncbi:MAG: DNA-formamidopyrimidine glycosylase family protein [Acidimicrobiales bacterium]
MPEILEVESYRRLAETAVGRTISSVVAPDAWYLRSGTMRAGWRRELVGKRLIAARRHGKILLLDTDGGAVLGIRFGMTGTLLVDGTSAVGRLLYAPRRDDPKWYRFTIRFDRGGTLAVHDPRRLGGIMLDPSLSRLGPDAASITGTELSASLFGSARPLKARLLDQSKVAGVGNLIADELLWRAALSPVRAAGSLSSRELQRLHRRLRSTLSDLAERGGSHSGHLMPERHPDGRCPQDGAGLARTTVGGRTTYWCPAHQH